MNGIPARKLTVVGAGYVGSTCTHLAALKNLAREVVLIDVLEGRAAGIALDLNQSAPIEGFHSRVVGTSDPADTADSDVVIVTAGRPRKPGMSRSDLLEVNGRVMMAVGEYIRRLSPDAVVIVVTNPLDSMVTLMRHVLGFPSRRVIGMAGVLDSARMAYFLAEAAGLAARDAQAMVLGAHGDSMVPMPEHCSITGTRALDVLDAATIDAIANRTRKGGAEIVKLLGTGSAWFAPASASVAMAESIVNDAQRMLPCACMLNGEFGFEGLYMGVPAVLGANGVERVLELPLSAEARAQMQKTAGAVQADIEAMRDLGLM
ncbi:MAG: malate dehydrogenase [Planctomycetota bacterium]|jgi:malate dehydrogenase